MLRTMHEFQNILNLLTFDVSDPCSFFLKEQKEKYKFFLPSYSKDTADMFDVSQDHAIVCK